MSENEIIIKQDDLKSITFQDVRFEVRKKINVSGVVYEYSYMIAWNGSLGETALEQASLHQAKNEYNNTRPTSDRKVMSTAEETRRQESFVALANSEEPKLVQAVAERQRVKKLSPGEIMTALKDKDLSKEKKAYYKSLLEVYLVEANVAKEALASLK